ncbi:hypothetical protein [Corynebacterium cystitidis]|uniref:NAD(P)H dehydrogenase (Quinone) n=1 Tax=Corynebacterium cystitidis DSM 20524 TaxID=1121357 RepID=A0A1H9TF84_9CORY|nr:hypothetical protein [Corynebacterium cystitidis]WJY83583.1 Quinone oxidoreductase 2 [Corynebacterium cystitidis DSM 20524]SER95499.1 NAD(P)H dehydrogenase (quinone) [Corynebacterium cystitidis DSM 20524]SNV91908.1 predicted nucleoside-diphosphate-sugar epimerase [Corynebacterium cystitidis]
MRDSGLDWVMLRNGSYWENYAANVEIAQHTGAMFGVAGNAVISGAARKNYAEAAVVVVSEEGHSGKVYELAGQPGLTYGEIAERIGWILGKPVTYQNASVAEYRSQLLEFGVPEVEAEILATLDEQIARGDMESASTDLEQLIGRPTTSLEEALRR